MRYSSIHPVRVAGAVVLLLGTVIGGYQSAEAEPYHVVKPMLEESDLQHAELRNRGRSWGARETAFGMWLMGGTRGLGIDELDRYLDERGYTGLGSMVPLFGLGASGVVEPLYLGFGFDFSGRTIQGPNGIRFGVNLVSAYGQLGYPVYSNDVLTVAPYLGVGFTTLSVPAASPDSGLSAPLQADQGWNGYIYADKTNGFVEPGLALQTFVPVVEKGSLGVRHGPGVGVHIGYAFPFLEDSWNHAHGPDGMASGWVVRLLFGYAFDRYEVVHHDEHVSECALGSGCELVCTDGYADCDLDPTNGCETEIGSVHDCGACGNRCSVAGGMPVCTNALRCGIATCDAGRADCNGKYADGCEAKLDTDARNCGACGEQCQAGEVCQAGACVSEEKP